MKEKIKQIALEMFMKYGLKSVSMDDIARAAGVSKKTIYQHVTDKQTLVHETLKDFLCEDQEFMSKELDRTDYDALEKMVVIAQKGFEMLKRIRPTVTYDLQKYYPESWNLIQEHHINFMQKKIFANIESGITQGVYRSNVNPDIISKIYVQNITSIVADSESKFGALDKAIIFVQQLVYHLYGIISYQHYTRLDSLTNKYNLTTN